MADSPTRAGDNAVPVDTLCDPAARNANTLQQAASLASLRTAPFNHSPPSKFLVLRLKSGHCGIQADNGKPRETPKDHRHRFTRIDVPTFDAMDWRISFLMETGFSQTRWRPVIRGHAVPSDIIAPIRGLSETTGPATQSDAAAGNRASNNIRRAQPPAHTFMAARRVGICPRRRACSPSRGGGPRRHPAHQNRGPAQ